MQYQDPNYEPIHRKLAPPAALRHYYGDRVRQLFLTAGLIMLLCLPFFSAHIPIPGFISLLAIIFIAVVAGVTNPMLRPVMILDIVVSLIALISFEYFAMKQYGQVPPILFGINQALALIFFFALYLSTKTFRGVLVGDYTIRQQKRRANEPNNPYRRPGADG